MMKRKSCASAFPRGSLLRPSVSSSWLCRSVRVPSEMGRHDTETLTERDSDAFVKFQPQACPPGPPRDTSRPTPRDACTFVPPKAMDKPLRGYEDIDWDPKISLHLKPPLSTLEKMADPVSQRFTLKRYHSRPELWQTIGPHWNRHQIRASYYVKKPFSFSSPCPKSGQIPLYSGVIGSENMDNIDIPENDFIPLTVLRMVLPPDTPTAHRPTIPGYTGKAFHDRPHTSQPSSVLTHHTTGGSSTPSSYGRQAPLSRMVTTVPPGNPFLQPKA